MRVHTLATRGAMSGNISLFVQHEHDLTGGGISSPRQNLNKLNKVGVV